MAAGSAAAPGVTCGGKPDLRSSGSSAQNNAMTRFVATYQQTCQGQTLNYTPSGSGAGATSSSAGRPTSPVRTPRSRTATRPPAPRQRCASPAWNLPLVFGPVAIAYNVPGVTDLVLDGPTAARVFNGQITTWNDPAIAALNPGKQLPAAPIVVNFRSDESGTTENFQKYLVAASNGAYGKGAAQTFNGGVGAGARGSQGVADATKNTPNSVTYVESSFAQRGGLGIAQIINAGGGQPVPLSTESVATAINNVQVTGQGNDLKLDLNSLYQTSAPGAYPIALATYEIVCSNYADDQTRRRRSGRSCRPRSRRGPSRPCRTRATSRCPSSSSSG